MDADQLLSPAARVPAHRTHEQCDHGGKQKHSTWAQQYGPNHTKAELCQVANFPAAAINLSLHTNSLTTGRWGSTGRWIVLDFSHQRVSNNLSSLERTLSLDLNVCLPFSCQSLYKSLIHSHHHGASNKEIGFNREQNKEVGHKRLEYSWNYILHNDGKAY